MPENKTAGSLWAEVGTNKKKKMTGAIFFSPLLSYEKYVYLLSSLSSETVNRFLPFALRRASTLRPLAVAMRALNPCLFTRLRLDGWNVLLLIVLSFLGVQK